MDGHDSEDPKQSAAEMTVFEQHLLQQMQKQPAAASVQPCKDLKNGYSFFLQSISVLNAIAKGMSTDNRRVFFKVSSATTMFSGWKYHVLVGTEADVNVQEGFDGRYLLEVDKYMEVVDVYALTHLGTTLKRQCNLMG
ncbi:hypothetical protein SADUNF_Sadunf18G0113500 [Salix dunnii]|uniref:Uncharacterized protein n=1 Tax=Salix dunnii TaxID=1413687 RepID=A0A835ME20_9ROSI|nr:hypothetical protein SADUNF_Sadunf18G0113500 [Salix dunnii]